MFMFVQLSVYHKNRDGEWRKYKIEETFGGNFRPVDEERK